MEDLRLFYPATRRNREPILKVLQEQLPPSGSVLELASGSGEHITFFAQALSGLRFLPSDPDVRSRQSIDAWRQHLGCANVDAARALDAHNHPWLEAPVDAILCINMIHITPWEATVALMEGASAALRPGGLLFTYGPYKLEGVHTASSNERFEREFLWPRDPRNGIRDIGTLKGLAEPLGLQLAAQIPMPANNFSLIWRRREAEG